MTKSPIALVAAFAIALTGLAACGDTSDGGAQQTKGEIKEGVGTVLGNDEMKQEGQKDQVVGGVKETVDDAKDAVKDATN